MLLTYKTHIAGGLLLAGMAYQVPALHQSEATVAGVVAMASLGALLPDIDHANSYLSNRNIFFKIFGFFVKHRTITHSLLFVVCSTLLAYIMLPVYTAYFALGVFSHLFLDALNPYGVPLLYPILKTRFKIPLVAIRTGKFEEFGLLIAFSFVAAKLFKLL